MTDLKTSRTVIIIIGCSTHFLENHNYYCRGFSQFSREYETIIINMIAIVSSLAQVQQPSVYDSCLCELQMFASQDIGRSLSCRAIVPLLNNSFKKTFQWETKRCEAESCTVPVKLVLYVQYVPLNFLY